MRKREATSPKPQRRMASGNDASLDKMLLARSEERTFEVDSKSWAVSRAEDVVTVRFGKIGTNGQTYRHAPDGTWAAAHRRINELIVEKMDKGYEEVAPRLPLREITDVEMSILDNYRASRDLLGLGQNARVCFEHNASATRGHAAHAALRRRRCYNPIVATVISPRVRCAHAVMWTMLLALTGCMRPVLFFPTTAGLLLGAYPFADDRRSIGNRTVTALLVIARLGCLLVALLPASLLQPAAPFLAPAWLLHAIDAASTRAVGVQLVGACLAVEAVLLLGASIPYALVGLLCGTRLLDVR